MGSVGVAEKSTNAFAETILLAAPPFLYQVRPDVSPSRLFVTLVAQLSEPPAAVCFSVPAPFFFFLPVPFLLDWLRCWLVFFSRRRNAAQVRSKTGACKSEAMQIFLSKQLDLIQGTQWQSEQVRKQQARKPQPWILHPGVNPDRLNPEPCILARGSFSHLPSCSYQKQRHRDPETLTTTH
eukprot:1339655-Rhodomonas_salina.1